MDVQLQASDPEGNTFNIQGPKNVELEAKGNRSVLFGVVTPVPDPQSRQEIILNARTGAENTITSVRAYVTRNQESR